MQGGGGRGEGGGGGVAVLCRKVVLRHRYMRTKDAETDLVYWPGNE